jgi:hypothetical protein
VDAKNKPENSMSLAHDPTPATYTYDSLNAARPLAVEEIHGCRTNMTYDTGPVPKADEPIVVDESKDPRR